MTSCVKRRFLQYLVVGYGIALAWLCVLLGFAASVIWLVHQHPNGVVFWIAICAWVVVTIIVLRGLFRYIVALTQVAYERAFAERGQCRQENMKEGDGAMNASLTGPTNGFGCCARCHMSWYFVERHTTNYSEIYGCFPLCECCWRDLTPGERLPYYRQLWESWGKPSDRDWAAIEAAVLAGY